MFYLQPCKLGHIYIFFFQASPYSRHKAMSVLCYRITCWHSIKPKHQVRYDKDVEEKNVYLSGSIDHHLEERRRGGGGGGGGGVGRGVGGGRLVVLVIRERHDTTRHVGTF